MTQVESEPRAVIVLITDDRVIPIGRIGSTTPCDLGLIDWLLRLQLAASRLGWSIRLTETHPELRELVGFVGVTDRFGL